MFRKNIRTRSGMQSPILSKRRCGALHRRHAYDLKTFGRIQYLQHISGTATLSKSQGVGVDTIKRAVEKFSGIPGRVERIDEGQDFTVVVDYAHTADSLEKVCMMFSHTRATSAYWAAPAGRDKWKRPEMGAIASRYCSHIVLTNEDPYDEDPFQIIAEIAQGITQPVYETIIDRRGAIAYAQVGADRRYRFDYRQRN